MQGFSQLNPIAPARACVNVSHDRNRSEKFPRACEKGRGCAMLLAMEMIPTDDGGVGAPLLR